MLKSRGRMSIYPVPQVCKRLKKVIISSFKIEVNPKMKLQTQKKLILIQREPPPQMQVVMMIILMIKRNNRNRSTLLKMTKCRSPI